MMSRSSMYADLWDLIRQQYVALTPRFASFRGPADNYLQLDAGGKAAHYEWKVLHAPRSHIEIAIHFEGPDAADNLPALEACMAKQASIRAGTLTQFIGSGWGGKWTRVGFQVDLDGESNQDVAMQSAELMLLLVERTYPLVKDRLEASSKTGWPTA